MTDLNKFAVVVIDTSGPWIKEGVQQIRWGHTARDAAEGIATDKAFGAFLGYGGKVEAEWEEDVFILSPAKGRGSVFVRVTKLPADPPYDKPRQTGA